MNKILFLKILSRLKFITWFVFIERTTIYGLESKSTLPAFSDLDRTYTLEGDNLKIYDVNIPAVEGALPILLYDYEIVSIDENELTLKNVMNNRENDLKELQDLFNEIQTLSNSVYCEDATSWTFVGYGSKACGGFQGFIAYSTNIDVVNIKKLVDEYTQKEDAYNKKYGIFSTCEITPAPVAVECVNGVPELIYSNTKID